MPAQDQDLAGPSTSTVLMEISHAMTAVYKDQFGRGPTRVRSEWAGPDTIVVVLDGTLTPAEKSLVTMGEHQRLRDIRMFFQYATVTQFCEPVERLTGRRVRAFVSGIDTLVDGLSTELFVLYPQGAEGPSRIELDAATNGDGRRAPAAAG